MAARIRTIKPEFFTHEKLFKLEQVTGLPCRLGFAGLWTQADREGRFKWRPVVIKLAVLPYDEHVDFGKLLEALRDAGFVEQYRDDNGELYGWVPSWDRNQSINNRETGSVLPAPADCVIMPAGPDPTLPLCLEAPAGGLIVDASGTREPRVGHASGTRQETRLEGKGREGKGREGKGKGSTLDASGTRPGDEPGLRLLPGVDPEEPKPKPLDKEAAFAEWYKLYPRHTKRDDAKKAYLSALRRIKVELKLEEEAEAAEWLLGRTRMFATSPLIVSTLEQEPHFVPYPASWLNSSDFHTDAAEWSRPRATAGSMNGKQHGAAAPAKHAGKLSQFHKEANA